MFSEIRGFRGSQADVFKTSSFLMSPSVLSSFVQLHVYSAAVLFLCGDQFRKLVEKFVCTNICLPKKYPLYTWCLFDDLRIATLSQKNSQDLCIVIMQHCWKDAFFLKGRQPKGILYLLCNSCMSSLKPRIFLYFFRRNGVVVEIVNALHAAGLAKLLHCVLRYALLGIVKASRTGVFLLGIVQCPPEKIMDALSWSEISWLSNQKIGAAGRDRCSWFTSIYLMPPESSPLRKPL